MKLSRLAAAITTAALAPAVLLASPAFATGQGSAAPADTTAPTAADKAGEDQAEQDRKTILAIIADPMASAYMKEAGHKAIADGPAAMRKFIEKDQHTIRRDDYRVLIARLANDAGPGLKEGIRNIFEIDATLEQLIHFYEVTQHELRDDDNKVEISRLVGTGGPVVREEGKKALKGTPADRIAFLKTGRYLAQAEDDRVELARIDEGWDGPILSEAIGKLLNGSPTPAELRHFLEVTQYELRDQDNRVAIAKIIDGGGPEVAKAGRAALAGTAADRTEFLKTGQHEARAKDKKAQEDKDKEEGEAKPTPTPTPAPSPGSSGTDTDTETGPGNTAVTPQGGSGPLATTGAGDTGWIVGGAGTALVAGAGLLLAARMRRAGSTS
ncbi:ALF repeat-containing protein [Streptomyces sp. NBC_00335]|uniref:ALF repeat-containing protein n=1 Tax=unclassified Streptomyces TaxID=2593676 RepID=UPI002256B810|nr:MULTISPECIES: ALF repeat-containing protein [unclassified Streptomyces]MCX5404676.1 ALF repeat-containing protein [Streptomyces sp. NBC_00086]